MFAATLGPAARSATKEAAAVGSPPDVGARVDDEELATSGAQAEGQQRVHLFDNLKFVMLTFVVVGHLSLYTAHGIWDPTQHVSWVQELALVIYTFDMPMFAVLSGAVTRASASADDCVRLLVFRLAPIMLVYSVGFGIDKLYHGALMEWKQPGGVLHYNPLDTNYAGGSRQLWYLAALVHWRLFLILTSGMRRWSLLLLSLVVGLGSGYCAGLSSEILYTRLFVDLGAVRARQLTVHVHGLLSIDRALALLPLYVGGHLAAQLSGLRVEGPDGGAASAPAEGAGGKTALADSAVKWLRRGPAGGTAAARGASLLAACALLGTAVGCHWPVRAWGYLYTFGWQTSYADAWIALGNSPADLDGSLTHSLLWVRRLATYLLAVALGACMLGWVPWGRVPFVSAAGKHSMYPYVLHVLGFYLLVGCDAGGEVDDATLLCHLRFAPSVRVPFGADVVVEYWPLYLLLLLAMPALVALLASRPVRFLFWPIVEPYWLFALFRPPADGERPRPWLHPALERFEDSRYWVGAQLGRAAFWCALLVLGLANAYGGANGGGAHVSSAHSSTLAVEAHPPRYNLTAILLAHSHPPARPHHGAALIAAAAAATSAPAGPHAAASEPAATRWVGADLGGANVAVRRARSGGGGVLAPPQLATPPSGVGG